MFIIRKLIKVDLEMLPSGQFAGDCPWSSASPRTHRVTTGLQLTLARWWNMWYRNLTVRMYHNDSWPN